MGGAVGRSGSAAASRPATEVAVKLTEELKAAGAGATPEGVLQRLGDKQERAFCDPSSSDDVCEPGSDCSAS